MIPTATKPGNPELPSSATNAVMLPTTPPKNAMFPAPTSNVRTIAKANKARPKSVKPPIVPFALSIVSNLQLSL